MVLPVVVNRAKTGILARLDYRSVVLGVILAGPKMTKKVVFVNIIIGEDKVHLSLQWYNYA